MLGRDDAIGEKEGSSDDDDDMLGKDDKEDIDESEFISSVNNINKQTINKHTNNHFFTFKQLPRVQRNLVEHRASFNKYFNLFLRELQTLSKTDMNVKKLYLRLDFNDFYKDSEETEAKSFGNISIDEEDDFDDDISGKEEENGNGNENSGNGGGDDDDDDLSY